MSTDKQTPTPESVRKAIEITSKYMLSYHVDIAVDLYFDGTTEGEKRTLITNVALALDEAKQGTTPPVAVDDALKEAERVLAIYAEEMYWSDGMGGNNYAIFVYDPDEKEHGWELAKGALKQLREARVSAPAPSINEELVKVLDEEIQFLDDIKNWLGAPAKMRQEIFDRLKKQRVLVAKAKEVGG